MESKTWVPGIGKITVKVIDGREYVLLADVRDGLVKETRRVDAILGGADRGGMGGTVDTLVA